MDYYVLLEQLTSTKRFYKPAKSPQTVDKVVAAQMKLPGDSTVINNAGGVIVRQFSLIVIDIIITPKLSSSIINKYISH